MLTVQDTRLAYKHRWAYNRRRPCRHHQGRRADKTMTSFHKNYIFEKRRQFLNRILGRNQFPPRKAGR